MKKILRNIFKIVFFIIVIGWISVILTDYYFARENKEPRFCLKNDHKIYDDGEVDICYGAGYKVINYNRRSISAIEFGPIFITERDAK